MQPNLTVFNIIMLIGAIQGIVVGTLVALGKGNRKQSNLLFACILFILSLDNLDTFFGDSFLDQLYPAFYLLSFSFFLAFGPLIYFYTLSVVDPSFKLKKTHLLHFVPAIIDLINYQSYFLIDFKISLLGQGATLQSVTAFAGDVGAIFSMAIYLVLSYKLSSEAHNKSTVNSTTLLWLKKIYIGVSIQWLMWVLYFSYLFVFDDYDHSFLRPYYLYAYLSILLYWFSIEGFLFSRKEQMPQSTKRTATQNSDPQLKILAEKLNQLMEEEKLYLDPELSLNDLAEKMGVGQKMMSNILNSGTNKSFNEYVNGYRVIEVKRRLSDASYSHLTILGIALESGFKSKATFNRCFKEFTNMSPQDFQKQFSRKTSLSGR